MEGEHARGDVLKGGFEFAPMLCFTEPLGIAAGMLGSGDATANNAADQLAVIEQAITSMPNEGQAGHHHGDDAIDVERGRWCGPRPPAEPRRSPTATRPAICCFRSGRVANDTAAAVITACTVRGPGQVSLMRWEQPSSPLAEWAAGESIRVLSVLPRRLRHTMGVARLASGVATDFAETQQEADLLVAAAYVHDIGYATPSQESGFHPLDGARHVYAATQELQLASLVAHHSCALVEARIRGLENELRSFPMPDPKLAEELTFCDMTVGPNGNRMSVHERLADIAHRYGPDHVVSRAVNLAKDEYVATVQRIEQRLQDTHRRTA